MIEKKQMLIRIVDDDEPFADAICREFEKMNTMQPMRAKVKITRHAMSHGEVR